MTHDGAEGLEGVNDEFDAGDKSFAERGDGGVVQAVVDDDGDRRGVRGQRQDQWRDSAAIWRGEWDDDGGEFAIGCALYEFVHRVGEDEVADGRELADDVGADHGSANEGADRWQRGVGRAGDRHG